MWFFLALLAALGQSLQDVSNKAGLKKLDPLFATWLMHTVIAPLSFASVLYRTGIPHFPPELLWPYVLGVACNIGGAWGFMAGLKRTDVSIVAPLQLMTPLVLLITSPLMLGQNPTAIGVIGVFLIVSGTYLMKLKKARESLLAPFKELFSDRGVQFAITGVVIMSFSSTFDGMGVGIVDGLSWYFFKLVGISVVLALVLRGKLITGFRETEGASRFVVMAGIFGFVSGSAQMIALETAIVPYVMSIKRLSVFFSVLLGYFIWKERGLKEKLLGVSVMFAGLLLILLAG